jgi:hypothetical protein
MTAEDRRPPVAREPAPSWPIAELVEGVHYYWSDELLVFTELYHRARGTCCGSACRHCPYDHVNVP